MVEHVSLTTATERLSGPSVCVMGPGPEKTVKVG